MQRRLLLLLPPHLPTEFIQRLDMPEAFAGDGAKGQGFEQMQRRGFADVADAEEFITSGMLSQLTGNTSIENIFRTTIA